MSRDAKRVSLMQLVLQTSHAAPNTLLRGLHAASYAHDSGLTCQRKAIDALSLDAP